VIATAWSASDTYLSLTVLVLLVLSGFFALAETSLVRMNKSRARSLQEQHRRGARALTLLTETPQKFLNPLLLLVLICQLVSATMVGVLADRLFGTAGLFIGIVGEVVVIFVFFEAIPKNYAVQHPDNAALLTAPVVSTLLKFWPIKWLSTLLLGVAQGVIRLVGLEGQTQKMTESEVLAMADVAQEDHAIESSERNFIHSVIEFGDTIVREVMVPRIDMVDIPDTATVREALDLAVATGRSRIPVLGEGVDDVVGIVNLRHLAGLFAEGRGSALVRDYMGEPRFVPETKRSTNTAARRDW
jgi:CBS domain containing-hemolysin-like protein